METLYTINSIYASSLSEPTVLKSNSSRLICGDKSGNINLWTVLKHGQRIRFDGLLVGHVLPITDLKMDDSLLVSVAQNELRVWSLDTKSCLAVYSLLAHPIVVHLDGAGIGVGTGDGHVLFLNRNGRMVLDCHKTLPSHHQGIQFIQILDELLVSVTVNGNIRAQSMKDGGLVWSMKASQRIISIEAMISPKRTILLKLQNYFVLELDLDTGSLIPSERGGGLTKAVVPHVLEAY
jgi:WD40 repeat protein